MTKVKRGDYVWLLDDGTPTQAEIAKVKRDRKTKETMVFLKWQRRIASGYVLRLDWFPLDRCWVDTRYVK